MWLLKALIHESCLQKEFIFISVGQRELQIKISSNDLINFLNMKVKNPVIE